MVSLEQKDRVIVFPVKVLTYKTGGTGLKSSTCEMIENELLGNNLDSI